MLPGGGRGRLGFLLLETFIIMTFHQSQMGFDHYYSLLYSTIRLVCFSSAVPS